MLIIAPRRAASHLGEFLECLQHPGHRPIAAAHEHAQIRHLTHVLLQRRRRRRPGHRQVNARQRVEIFAGAQRFPQRLAPPPAALAVDEDEQRGPLAGLSDVGRHHVRGLRDVEGSRVVVARGRRRRGLERDGAVKRWTATPEAGRGGRLRRGVLARARGYPQRASAATRGARWNGTECRRDSGGGEDAHGSRLRAA